MIGFLEPLNLACKADSSSRHRDTVTRARRT